MGTMICMFNHGLNGNELDIWAIDFTYRSTQLTAFLSCRLEQLVLPSSMDASGSGVLGP